MLIYTLVWSFQVSESWHLWEGKEAHISTHSLAKAYFTINFFPQAKKLYPPVNTEWRWVSSPIMPQLAPLATCSQEAYLYL